MARPEGDPRLPRALRQLVKVVVYLAATALLATVLVGLQPAQRSDAALTGSQFVAGDIISDANFYNATALTEGEIQAFLDSKIGTCGNTSCLNVLTATVASRGVVLDPLDSTKVRCNAFTGGTLSAAQIIYNAQVACGISAEVLLVTLQKEQGLVTSRAPSAGALNAAMGYACPDSRIVRNDNTRIR